MEIIRDLYCMVSGRFREMVSRRARRVEPSSETSGQNLGYGGNRGNMDNYGLQILDGDRGNWRGYDGRAVEDAGSSVPPVVKGLELDVLA